MMELWRWNGYVVLYSMSGVVNFTVHDEDNAHENETVGKCITFLGEILYFMINFYQMFTIWQAWRLMEIKIEMENCRFEIESLRFYQWNCLGF